MDRESIPITMVSLIPAIAASKGEGLLLILAIVLPILFITGGLLFSMQQTIRIDEKGVHYKQRPFHRTFRTIPWSDIQDWKLNRLDALGEVGGWGIRRTRKKNGYIIEGNYCLELKIDQKKAIVFSIKNSLFVQLINAYFA